MGSPELEHPKVFISYSHDSSEHQDRVLQLANRLRQEGVDALVDQYEPAPATGWPMWMDREIQKADFILLVCTETYLRRVEGREEPGRGRGVLWEAKLIYNSLYEVDTALQRFIPILVEGGDPSCIPLPVRGVTYYRVDTEEGYEGLYRHLTGQLGQEKPVLGRLKALSVIMPQSYPASLDVRPERKPPTSLDQRNRLQILKRVRLDWIDGVLNKSLYKVARIELGLEAKTDAVEQPLNAIVQVPDGSPRALRPGTTISKIFDDCGGALLILGAPGTGKTTLLLELLRDLLDRAEKDESDPIPVVFNLSTWAVRRQPLEKWLVAELNERNDVPRRIGQDLVETEQVLPLLDGLDEVALDYRQACVDAINNFRRGHGLLPIAVCSRIRDYEALGKKLRLRSAVVVQPLTKHQVQNYLERIGEPVSTLRAALEQDPSLWELLEIPLMLWVATLAYRDSPTEFPREDTVDQRHRRLLAKFVDAMFKKPSGEARYTPNQTISWLSWLAKELTLNNQTVFYLENLHVGWLRMRTRTQRWLITSGVAVANGLIAGLVVGPTCGLIARLSYELSPRLIFGQTFGPRVGYELLKGQFDLDETIVRKTGPAFGLLVDPQTELFFGLAFGLIAGLIAGLSTAFMELRPVDTIRLSVTDMPSRTPKAIRSGLIVGVIFGLTYALLVGLLLVGKTHWLIVVLTHGLTYGLIFGLIAGLIKLLCTEAVEIRISPNQGTLRSLAMASSAMVIFGPISGLIFRLISGPRVGLNFGLLVGLLVGLIGGGAFSIRHFVIRLFLGISRLAPFNYVRFLDYAAERLFLYKVGGGYIFVHRFLLEYFASLATRGRKQKK